MRFEMEELDAVPESEVRSAADDGVSVVSGEFEPLLIEEVFEVPEFRGHFTPDPCSIPLDGHR